MVSFTLNGNDGKTDKFINAIDNTLSKALSVGGGNRTTSTRQDIVNKVKDYVENHDISNASYKDKLVSLIAPHIPVLILKWDQSGAEVPDEYGKHNFDKWKSILQDFIERVVQPELVVCNTDAVAIFIGERVLDAKIKNIESGKHDTVNVDLLTPEEFEHYCGDLLRQSGWNARVTKASGDQGIDVIALYGNVKAVLQCKKYSQPVGNAAVQEIIAGKAFEQAHVAVVVSNAPFTPSAKQLAATTGVYLLHFSELPKFAVRLGLVDTLH